MATADPIVDADYRAHLETYHDFVRGLQIAVATIATILVLLYVFLA